MKTLGKVAFVPVIASGMIAAGAGAGAAMAATTPGATVTPNTTKAVPFTAKATLQAAITSKAVSGNEVGFTQSGDTLVCTVSQNSIGPKTYYFCTDNANHISGWIDGAAIS